MTHRIRFAVAGAALMAAFLTASRDVRAQTTLPVEPVPVSISDMAKGSYSVRFEYREKPNPAIWPESRNLKPLHDTWVLSYAVMSGESPQYVQAGDKIIFREGSIVGDGVTPTTGIADLQLFQVARKWTGVMEGGGELDGFLGLGVIAGRVQVDGGAKGKVNLDRDAPGLVLGFGLAGTLASSVGIEGRIGVFLNDPFFIFTGSTFAGGFSSDAVFGEVGVVWPKNGSVGIRAGFQGIRYVPEKEDYESPLEVNLWGPFLGIWVAIK